MNAASFLTRLHLSPQSSGAPSALPTLAACGGSPDRYVKAMERHFAGDVAKLHAHVAQLGQSEPQSATLQTAFIDGSEALRNFLGIRNPDGFHKKYLSFGSSSPRIPDSEAPAALAMAATRSAKGTRVLRSLARLEETLRAHPPGHHASHDYHHSVETAFGQLLQGLHALPTEAARQKAVELIERHLPQLDPRARAHIQSLARKAMGRQNIGNELKTRLQELSQSQGTAKLGALLNMGESSQPERADNSGKAGFSAILKNSAVAPQSETTNPASRPYAPIKLKTYPGDDEQMKVKVQCTDYARQAAELLIDRNGELDGSHISRMLDQLKTDKALPAAHRRHLMRTLVMLKQGGELAKTINSICRDKPLKGGAADVVRGTLNLPPEHEPTKEDARKAVVMSLLGYLRQGTVGNCYAAAPAICLLDSSPEVVAGNMKELLEDRKLTFQQDGALVEVPLNQHVYQGAKVTVGADGTCDGKSNGFRREHYKLQDSPGMQAALNALGIPENERQAAIAGALSQMGLTGARYMMHTVDCKQIIEHLAHTTPGVADPDKRIAAALRAFNGKQDVGLLQTWEYTLATAAHMHTNMHWEPSTVYQISTAAIYGDYKNEIPGRPELQSPAQKSTAIVEQLRSDPRLNQIKLDGINLHLFNEINGLFQKRFVQQFDMNISGAPASDGVSISGGFTLYEKIPADNPSQWKRIDSADAFQEAVARLVKDASETARTHIDGMDDGDPETKREALRLIADHVVAGIRDKTFIEHAVLRMNAHTPNQPDAAGQPSSDVNRYQRTPWQIATGGFPEQIAKMYGGKLVSSNCIFSATESNMPSALPSGATQPRADDMMPLVNFLWEGLTKMAPELQAKAQESPGGFKLPMTGGFHAFALTPMEMKEIWSDNPVTPEKWVDDNLKSPAMQWLKETRTSPPLLDLLKSVGAQIGADPGQIQSMYGDMHERAKKFGRLNFKEPPYTLHDVHEKLNTYCRSQENGDELLAKTAEVVTNTFPIPAKAVADTNWSSLLKGQPEYIGILYNPFTDKVEGTLMHQDGTNRRPLGDNWFDEGATWNIYTPLASNTKPPVNVNNQ